MFLVPIYRAEDAAQVMKGWRDFMATRAGRDRRNAGRVLHHPGRIRNIPRRPGASGSWRWPGCGRARRTKGERAVQPLREFATPVLDFSAAGCPTASVQKPLRCAVPQGRSIGPTSSRSIMDTAWTTRMIDEIAPRAADRPSDLIAVLGVVSWAARVGRVAEATRPPSASRNMRYMLSIDSIWEKSGGRTMRPTSSWVARLLGRHEASWSGGRAYLNFAGPRRGGRRTWCATAMAPPTTPRLGARLKARYDPTNLFRLNQNIKPSA